MAPRSRTAATGLVLFAATSGVDGRVWGHPRDDLTEYPIYPGFTLTLVEEFDEPLDLDNDPIWTWSDGGLHEGLVRFAKEQITFPDGKMRITADSNQTVTRDTQACSQANAGTWEQGKWNLYSGEIRTRRNQFRYGRYEVSMKAPSVKPNDAVTNGNYIATMFAFKDANELNWREVDIEVTGDSPSSVTTNIFYANDQWWWSADIAASDAAEIDGLNSRTGFHVYAFEWLPTGVDWYVDGKHFRRYDNTSADTSNFDLTAIPELATKIMMSLWVFDPDGGNFGGPEHGNNQYPFWVEYEWFRFYKWDQDIYPCDDLHNPACLTEVDRHRDANNPCDGIAQVGIQCNASTDSCSGATATSTTTTLNIPSNPRQTTQVTIIMIIVVLLAVGAGVYAMYGSPHDDDNDIPLASEGS